MLALFPLTLLMALKFLTSGSSHTTGTVALIRSHVPLNKKYKPSTTFGATFTLGLL